MYSTKEFKGLAKHFVFTEVIWYFDPKLLSNYSLDKLKEIYEQISRAYNSWKFNSHWMDAMESVMWMLWGILYFRN
jgi:hypothetical protein